MRVRLGRSEWVFLPREDFDRMALLADAAHMPALPQPGEDGTFPAVEYARASIARTIVHARAQAGWTQRELARQAGVRVETLCRIEKGHHSASTATVAKIERALRRAGGKGKSHAGRGSRAAG